MREHQDRTPGVVLDRVSPSSEWLEGTCESEQGSLQKKENCKWLQWRGKNPDRTWSELAANVSGLASDMLNSPVFLLRSYFR